MKKSLHIVFLSLFLISGVQCLAANKKSTILLSDEMACFYKVKCNGKFISKQETSSFSTTAAKLYKKKRHSISYQNAIARLSKCYGFDLIFGTVPSSKFLFQNNSEHDFSSEYSKNSFSFKGKLLSFFYPFQAFW